EDAKDCACQLVFGNIYSLNCLFTGQKTVRVFAQTNGQDGQTSAHGEADFLVGPFAFVKSGCQHSHQCVCGAQGEFDFILPFLRRLNVLVCDEARNLVCEQTPLKKSSVFLPFCKVANEQSKVIVQPERRRDARRSGGALDTEMRGKLD